MIDSISCVLIVRHERKVMIVKNTRFYRKRCTLCMQAKYYVFQEENKDMKKNIKNNLKDLRH